MGQLIRQENIQRMISDEQIFALAENVRGASQNAHKANEEVYLMQHNTIAACGVHKLNYIKNDFV